MTNDPGTLEGYDNTPGRHLGTNDNAIVNLSEGSGQYLTSILKISRENIKAIHFHQFRSEFYTVTWSIACVASVSVLFRCKEGPSNGILCFGRTRNEARAKK